MIHELTVSHVLVMSQGIKTKPQRETVSHQLTFSQSIRHNIRTRKLVSTLALTQSVAYRRSVVNVSVGHTLSFSQVVAKNPIYVSVLHNLGLWQTIKRPKWEKVTQNINFGHGINGQQAYAVKNTLSFTQTIVGNVIRNRIVTHTLGLINGVSAFLANPNFNYLNPTFTIIDQVRFKRDDFEIYLRKPDFDDTHSYDFTRISRRSRGGDIIISRDGIWPAVKSLSLRFTFLSQKDIDLLLAFMKYSLGKKIRYLNYDSIEWEGFITNPQTEAVQAGRDNFGITIEFQGEPLV